MRDHPAFALDRNAETLPTSPSQGLTMNGTHGHDLRDSLWFFDGQDMRVWIDMQDVLSSASAELGRDLPTPVKIPVDFYPLSALINKAIIFGVESEFIQRRDTNFAFLRFGTRVSWRLMSNNRWFVIVTLLTYSTDASLPSRTATLSFGAIQPSGGPPLESSLPTSFVLPSCFGNLAT